MMGPLNRPIIFGFWLFLEGEAEGYLILRAQRCPGTQLVGARMTPVTFISGIPYPKRPSGDAR